MFKLIFTRRVRLAVMTASVLACACGQPPDDSAQQQVQERLVGTWLREYQEDATQVSSSAPTTSASAVCATAASPRGRRPRL